DRQAGEAEGKRHADQHSADSSGCRDAETVSQAVEEEAVRQDGRVVRQREVLAGSIENAGAEDLQDRPQEEQPEEHDRDREDRDRKRIAVEKCPHAVAASTTTRWGSKATVTAPDLAGGISAIRENAVPSASVTAKRVTGPRYSISPSVPLKVTQRGGAASPADSRRRASGRTERMTFSFTSPRTPARRSVVPATAISTVSPSRARMTPSSRLVVPTKLATKGVAGRS